MFALIGSQLFKATLRQKSVRNPSDLSLAPPFSTLLLIQPQKSLLDKIRYNQDQVNLIRDDVISLWFQNTLENGAIMTKLDDTPQTASIFGDQYNALRWKRSDGDVMNSLLDNIQLHQQQHRKISGAWHESALLKIHEMMTSQPVAMSNCTCVKDDSRCRYTLKSRKNCSYKFENCNYLLNVSDVTCDDVISATDHQHMEFWSDYCFNSSVPSCMSDVRVAYHHCHFNSSDINDVCSARATSNPLVVCQFTTDDVIEAGRSLLQSQNFTESLVESILYKWSLGNISTLANNITNDNSSRIDEYGANFTLNQLRHSTFNSLKNCSNQSAVVNYKSSNRWLSGVVVEFQFVTKLPSNQSDISFDKNAIRFVYYVPKSVEELKDLKMEVEPFYWNELIENQARQEPQAGQNFHPQAADRFKQDHHYCILGK